MSQPIAPDTAFGKYRIVSFLGTGGMADVWEAVDTTLERHVALKLLPPELGKDPEKLKRFRKEVLAVAALEHPGIVTIYEVGDVDGRQFYAMSLVRGGNLKDRVRKGQVTPRTALDIIRQVSMALQHAHDRGIIHRDVKPENILFSEDGLPVIADFGIAKVVGSSTAITAMGTSVGTPFYMSPEQADPDHPVDHRTDLYSLGVVLYEMLCRRVPYRATTAVGIALRHRNDPIPRLPDSLAGLQPLLDRMMAKRVDQRYAQANDLIRDLDLLKNLPLPETVSVPAEDEDDTAATPEDDGGETEFDLMEVTPSGDPPPSVTDDVRLDPVDRDEPSSSGDTRSTARRDRMRRPDPPAPESTGRDTRSTARRRPLSAPRPDPAPVPEAIRPVPETGMGWRIGLTGAGVAVAATLVWLMWPESDPTDSGGITRSPPPGPPAAAVEADAEPSEPAVTSPDNADSTIRVLLAEAEMLMDEGRLASPSGASALDRSREVLRLDPDNQRALGMIETIGLRLLDQVRNALEQDRLDEADGLLDLARGLDPPPEGITGLAAELVSARQKPAPAPVSQPPPEPERKPEPQSDPGARVRDLLAEAERLRQARQLTTPAGANAVERYQEVLELDPGNPRARIGIRQVAETYLEWSREALDDGEVERAEQHLARAGSVDPLAAGLGEQRLRIDEAREAAEASASAGPPAASPAAGDPAEPPEVVSAETIDPPAPESTDQVAPTEPAAGIPDVEDFAPVGEEFADPLRSGTRGPRMMALPAGRQAMGREDDHPSQGPVHEVVLRPFAISKFEITRREFARFVEDTDYQTTAELDGGCNYWLFGWRRRANKSWRSPGFEQEDGHPVVCVSRNDAEAYVRWLSDETGHRYTLPSEAQWEYAARASTDRLDFWQAPGLPACRFANVSDLTRADEHSLVTSPDNVFGCADGYVTTSPSGSFSGNDFEIFDLLGNAGEWVADCWHGNYEGAPSDGQPWMNGDCEYGLTRGGSWYELPANVTTTFRLRIRGDQAFSHIGFRVVRNP